MMHQGASSPFKRSKRDGFGVGGDNGAPCPRGGMSRGAVLMDGASSAGDGKDGISASTLFLAAAIPGVMIMVSIMVTNMVMNRIHNYEGDTAGFSLKRWRKATTLRC